MYTTQGEFICKNITEKFQPAFVNEQEKQNAWNERYHSTQWGNEDSLLENFYAQSSSSNISPSCINPNLVLKQSTPFTNAMCVDPSKAYATQFINGVAPYCTKGKLSKHNTQCS